MKQWFLHDTTLTHRNGKSSKTRTLGHRFGQVVSLQRKDRNNFLNSITLALQKKL